MAISNEKRQLGSPVERARSWAKRHKTGLAIGAIAVGAALPFLTGNGQETIETAKDVAPWVATGMVASEAAWIGGAAMCVAGTRSSIGGALRHPKETRQRFNSIAVQANQSTLFKAGLTINTAAAVAQFAIPAAAIVGNMPPEALGLLTLPTVDLVATISARVAIVAAMRSGQEQQIDAPVV